MTEESLFAGPAIRRLRKREGLTQAAAAKRLDISPSYLNLIERNQRPVSARVMMQLVSQFDFDPKHELLISTSVSACLTFNAHVTFGHD